MKHILCFGDSNLFGTNPRGGRWPLTMRWTGLLSQALGEGYRIIEEGLGGRTTLFDDPLEENRNGLTHLPVMLHSHRPLDLVILSLGTNDCKRLFNANAKIIAKALEKLALLIKSYPYGEHYPTPQVLIVAPVHIGERVGDFFASFDETSSLLSKQLGPAIKEMAQRNGFLFLDASLVATSSPIDQLHLDGQAHTAMAEAMLPILLSWFGDERPRAAIQHVDTLLDNKEDTSTSVVGEEEQEETEGEQQKKEEAAPSSKRARVPLSFRLFRKRV